MVDGKAMGVPVGACVLVGVADGAGVAALVSGSTLAGDAGGRSAGVTTPVATATTSIAAGMIAAWGTSVGLAVLQPVTTTAANCSNAISLAGLQLCALTDLAGIITFA
jgi:hypothetical protein